MMIINSMKKKIGLALVISQLLVACACGKKVPETAAPSISGSGIGDETEISREVSVSVEISDGNTEAGDISKAPELSETVRMYADYLNKLYNGSPDAMYGLRYDLVYIDGDDVPELIYMEGDYHAATVHLCMAYVDGVYEVGEFGQYGSFAYVPGGDKIVSFYMGMGNYLYDYFRLENRTLQEEVYLEMSEDPDDIDKNIYYIDGDEVDAETYREALDKAQSDNYRVYDYYGAISYIESYDVFEILNTYAIMGVRPHTIEMTSEILGIQGDYYGVQYGPEFNEIKDINEYDGIYAGFSMDAAGYVSVWYGNGEVSFADYAMPIGHFADALSIVETGGLWEISAISQDMYREYKIYAMPDGTVKVVVFDSHMSMGAGKETFIFERDDH